MIAPDAQKVVHYVLLLHHAAAAVKDITCHQDDAHSAPTLVLHALHLLCAQIAKTDIICHQEAVCLVHSQTNVKHVVIRNVQDAMMDTIYLLMNAQIVQKVVRHVHLLHHVAVVYKVISYFQKNVLKKARAKIVMILDVQNVLNNCLIIVSCSVKSQTNFECFYHLN